MKPLDPDITVDLTYLTSSNDFAYSYYKYLKIPAAYQQDTGNCDERRHIFASPNINFLFL